MITYLKALLLSLPLPFLALVLLAALYPLSWWTSRGRRVICQLIPIRRPLSAWQRLSTPRRCIYHRPTEHALNAVVRDLFVTKATLEQVVMKIRRVLAKDADAVATATRYEQWKAALAQAEFFRIYRRAPLLAGGWAQTRNGRTSDCVLGLEGFYLNLGPWTTETIGHECVHVAQEIREHALRREWNRPVPSLRWQLRIEGEAHYCFRLWPYTISVLTVAVFIACVYWDHLWP